MSHSENKSSSYFVVILLGPPGSGKGTQAMRISKELGLSHISTGDLCREHLKKETALGKQMKEFMETGKLVPDALILDILFERISQKDCARGFLLDGFPRTLEQAESLSKRLQKDVKLKVIDLEVPDDSIIKRMSGRLTCKQCGKIYNRHSSPPVTEGVCDACQGELYQRNDDKAEIVKERLRIYHLQTKPLVKYYEDAAVLSHVSGDRPPDQVYAKILSVLTPDNDNARNDH